MLDIIKSMLDHSKERVRQPFLGAFTFSFAAFNWDIFYYLYASDYNVETKIEYVKSTYNIESDVVLPAIVALLVVFVPVFVNSVRQLIQEVLNYTIERIRLRYSKLDLDVARNNAEKEYEPKRVEKEHNNNMELIRQENKNLNSMLEDMNKTISVNEDHLEHLSEANRNLRDSNKEKESEIKHLKSKINELSETLDYGEF